MNIAGIIEYFYPEAKALINYELRDDGEGVYISKWELNEPKPTKESLLSKKGEYDIAMNQRKIERKQRKIAIAQKLGISTKEEFKAMKELIEDGNVD